MAIDEIVGKLDTLDEIQLNYDKNKISTYRILEQTGNYKGHDLNLAVCYSESLKATKEGSVLKGVEKETERIEKIQKALSKRQFACEEDANREIDKIKSKDFKNLKFHDVSFSLRKEEKRRRGRPALNAALVAQDYHYLVDIVSIVDPDKVTLTINKECCFVLCSNDLAISGERMLREYTERIEAFSYLMLICILILSLAEYVVRRGLSQDGDHIIGPANVKMKRPTQRAIYIIVLQQQTIKTSFLNAKLLQYIYTNGFRGSFSPEFLF